MSEWGDYVTTPYAKHGAKGSELKPIGEPTKWRQGATAQVTWQIVANHGGGCGARGFDPSASIKPPACLPSRTSATDSSSPRDCTPSSQLRIQAVPGQPPRHRGVLPSAPARLCARPAATALRQRLHAAHRRHLCHGGNPPGGVELGAQSDPAPLPRSGLLLGAPVRPVSGHAGLRLHELRQHAGAELRAAV